MYRITRAEDVGIADTSVTDTENQSLKMCRSIGACDVAAGKRRGAVKRFVGIGVAGEWNESDGGIRLINTPAMTRAAAS